LLNFFLPSYRNEFPRSDSKKKKEDETFCEKNKEKRGRGDWSKDKRTNSMLALIFVTNHPGLQLNPGLEKYFKGRDPDGSAWCGTGDGRTRTWVMRAKFEAKKQKLETGFAVLLSAVNLAAHLQARKNAVAQELHDQEEAGEEDEAEQAHPSLDPYEDRQHHQVQCETQALAPHQARILRCLAPKFSMEIKHILGLEGYHSLKFLIAL
ncbi:hypothetical protein DVH24_012792, partial [Malus domestica]